MYVCVRFKLPSSLFFYDFAFSSLNSISWGIFSFFFTAASAWSFMIWKSFILFNHCPVDEHEVISSFPMTNSAAMSMGWRLYRNSVATTQQFFMTPGCLDPHFLRHSPLHLSASQKRASNMKKVSDLTVWWFLINLYICANVPISQF